MDLGEVKKKIWQQLLERISYDEDREYVEGLFGREITDTEYRRGMRARDEIEEMIWTKILGRM
jgi:hypothetical protein